MEERTEREKGGRTASTHTTIHRRFEERNHIVLFDQK